MLPVLTSLVIATTFSSASPTKQLGSTELSLPPSFRLSIWDTDTLDLLPDTSNGSDTSTLTSRDNGDIAAGLGRWNSRLFRSYGLYQWTFGSPLQQYNISMDTCLKKSSVVGVWEFADGTTKNDATVKDIMIDLGFGTGSTVPPQKYNARLSRNALLAVKETKAFSDTLLCDASATTALSTTQLTPGQLEDQASLRHLLFESEGRITAAVVAAGYATAVYMFYNVLALYVINPVGKIILQGTSNLGIVLGAGLIGLIGNNGDFVEIEAAIVGSVFVARLRQIILQATQAGRAAGPCLPVTQVTAAAIQAAADAGTSAGSTGQGAATANPGAGAGSAVGTTLARTGSCPNFQHPVRA